METRFRRLDGPSILITVMSASFGRTEKCLQRGCDDFLMSFSHPGTHQSIAALSTR
jgi:hypothetical protein